MSPFIEYSTTGIGRSNDRHYSLVKFRDRRRWTLIRHDGAMNAAAYFKTETEARQFADTFGLTITDHQETQ